MSIEIREARAGDGAALHAMVRSLAESHGELAQFRASPADYEVALFGEHPLVGALLALADGVPAGCAIWHRSFSTFRGRETMYLEDLSVLEAYRRQGIARMLLKAVARLAVARGMASISWHLMAWNDGARALYEEAGADIEEGVCICRLHGAALERWCERDSLSGL
ncbi:N-acetyltransferase family protein [Aestuariivirga sp.]|uniref:GNAT family N-acetyltransferase n=1 Tax=Aestuariivirga sp. TaxID=2650926 RepID=UPI003593AB42